jgi:hypothetical protein
MTVHPERVSMNPWVSVSMNALVQELPHTAEVYTLYMKLSIKRFTAFLQVAAEVESQSDDPWLLLDIWVASGGGKTVTEGGGGAGEDVD